MPRSNDQAPPGVVALGRFLEICVYAPLGAGARLIDDAPSAVARARQELSNARFIGRMVVNEGESRLRERLAGGVEPASMPSTPASVRPVDTTPDERNDPVPDVPEEPAVDAIDGERVTDADLALPDYDHLPAIDVIDQLESLTIEELDSIERYERDNRRRRTVLGKIAQLRDAS